MALAVVAVMFLYVSSAAALTSGHKRVAPPGNSGVSEYQENIPTAGGGKPVQAAQSLATQPAVLAPTVSRDLTKTGAVGKHTAALAEATAPPVSHSSHRTRSALARLLRGQSSAIVGSLTNSIAGGDGDLGVLLPVLLVATALLAAALALMRRRSR